MAKYLFYI